MVLGMFWVQVECGGVEWRRGGWRIAYPLELSMTKTRNVEKERTGNYGGITN